MISPELARRLRDKGHDVLAIKKERPELKSIAGSQIVKRMAHERRVIVTNNVEDFRPLHDATAAAREEHYEMVFTFDATMPRNKASISLWIQTLDRFLAAHPDEDALKNRIHHLP